MYICCISFDSYIKPQLSARSMPLRQSCISFDSYIKPQHQGWIDNTKEGCISFDSYIKPQQVRVGVVTSHVVYLLIPTSNHNL